MKIHIDTATAQEQAKAKKIAPQGKNTAKGKKPASSPGSLAPNPAPGQPSTLPTWQRPSTTKKPNLPKSPPKEPTPPRDVKDARKRQSKVLKERQKRETQGKAFGSRDIDAGSGFWPPLSPLL